MGARPRERPGARGNVQAGSAAEVSLAAQDRLGKRALRRPPPAPARSARSLAAAGLSIVPLAGRQGAAEAGGAGRQAWAGAGRGGPPRLASHAGALAGSPGAAAQVSPGDRRGNSRNAFSAAPATQRRGKPARLGGEVGRAGAPGGWNPAVDSGAPDGEAKPGAAQAIAVKWGGGSTQGRNPEQQLRRTKEAARPFAEGSGPGRAASCCRPFS